METTQKPREDLVLGIAQVLERDGLDVYGRCGVRGDPVDLTAFALVLPRPTAEERALIYELLDAPVPERGNLTADLIRSGTVCGTCADEGELECSCWETVR